MAKLSAHPAIVTIYQASISADGRPVLRHGVLPRHHERPLQEGAARHRRGARHRRAHRRGPRDRAPGRPAAPRHQAVERAHQRARLAGARRLRHRGSGVGRRRRFPRSSPCRCRGAHPRCCRSGCRARCPARSGASAPRSTRCSPAAARSRRRRGRRTPASSWCDASRRRATRPLPVDGLPAAHRRDPRRRPCTATRPSVSPSMAEFAEQLRWAQYELGIPSTSFDVASPEWAAASPIRFTDTRQRGPVVTTVDEELAPRGPRGAPGRWREAPSIVTAIPVAAARALGTARRSRRRRHRRRPSSPWPASPPSSSPGRCDERPHARPGVRRAPRSSRRCRRSPCSASS